MTIFVQWKWQETTQTFLMILHLDADWSKSNLRKKEMCFYTTPNNFLHLYFPSVPYQHMNGVAKSEIWKEGQTKKRTVTTWAPSHIEIGFLAELLCYANIINGFKLWQREALKTKLDVSARFFKDIIFLTKRIEEVGKEKALEELDARLERGENELDVFLKFCGEKPYLMGSEGDFVNHSLESIFCFELSQNYIDYLKEILKPYLKRN